LLAGAVLWLWAVYALWHSTASVPEGPSLSPHRFFSDSFLARSSSYERFLVVDGLLAALTLIAVLAVYARRGHRLMRESAAGRVGTGMMLGMLGFAVVWLAEVPFGLAAVWWQRSHDVSHQGYLEWIFVSFVGLGSTFVFVAAALAIAMGLAGVAAALVVARRRSGLRRTGVSLHPPQSLPDSQHLAAARPRTARRRTGARAKRGSAGDAFRRRGRRPLHRRS
jgi:hypothetical protein